MKDYVYNVEYLYKNVAIEIIQNSDVKSIKNKTGRLEMDSF